MGRPGCACARARCGASAITAIGSASAACRTLRSAPLRFLRIDALEVIEHETPLFRRQPAQIVPVRRGEPRCRLAVGVRVRWHEQLDSRRRLRFTLSRVLAFVTLERPTGVQHTPEQPLLAVDHVRIERAALERMRELSRFLRELLGAAGLVVIAHLLERRSDFALLATELACLLASLLIELSARPWDELRRLRVQRALLLSHV